MPTATVFDLSISEHVKRAFARDIQYFCFMETQFPIKQKTVGEKNPRRFSFTVARIELIKN